MEKESDVIKHECAFCKRSFSKEISLINHSCEKKRRWFAKDQPHVIAGFMAWTRFYELNASSFKKTGANYEGFMNSKYYNAFIKFGKHIKEINPLEPAKFIDFVLKSNIPLDKWTNDFVYDQYVRELIRRESPESALERNLVLMTEWSATASEEWYNFFRKVNTNQAVLWIKNGKISPWVLYNADSAADFFERCNSEQLGIIKTIAPPGPWKIKFNKNVDSCKFIKDTLRQNGM